MGQGDPGSQHQAGIADALRATFHNVSFSEIAAVRPRRRADRLVFCCAAFGRYWHKAAEHILIGDGRFRGEADMHSGVASTNSVEFDPNQT
jgi:hypothetical protein